jgi:hypothetical protein
MLGVAEGGFGVTHDPHALADTCGKSSFVAEPEKLDFFLARLGRLDVDLSRRESCGTATCDRPVRNEDEEDLLENNAERLSQRHVVPSRREVEGHGVELLGVGGIGGQLCNASKLIEGGCCSADGFLEE